MNLPQFVFWLSPEHAKIPATRKAGSPKRGEYITVFREASKFLRIRSQIEFPRLLTAGLANAARSDLRSPRASGKHWPQPSLFVRWSQIYFASRLTNFFDLSNIRSKPGGPVKCLGPHDVLEECLLNSMGHRRWELIGSPGVIVPFHQKMLCGLSESGACWLVGWTSSARFAVQPGTTSPE